MDPRRLREPHHDGSGLHLDPGHYRIGDRVAVRIRVPSERPAQRVLVRTTPDGEPRFTEARIDRTDAHQTWWVAELEIGSAITNYRFLIERPGPSGLSAAWLNSAGVHAHDIGDAGDFRITIHRPPPAWLADTVGYQIFPDRFAASNDLRHLPDWAVGADWDTPVESNGRRAVRQLYGGDLTGVERRLDHLDELGVNLVYLTPFFPARSSHRYDATTFEQVDPLLGGDQALASLTAAAHRRGIRVIGDLTLNHTGDHHDWFGAAQRDQHCAEAGFYFFDQHPDRYAAWYDLPHLPKLDHRDPELTRRLFDGDQSVVASWLRPPYSLDGWRVDCANTTGRHGLIDVNRTVARHMRTAMEAAHPDPWLLAEHCYDATGDLAGEGWHGTMAYQWFTRPLSQWLGTADPIQTMSDHPLARLDAQTTMAAMSAMSAGLTWPARTASMTMLDSHDTARFRSVVSGDRHAHLSAMVALMTMPGVPTIFAGSEVGVGGDAMDTARVPFPWDRRTWDAEMWHSTRGLVALRRSTAALQTGGFRWLEAGTDRLAFLRETSDDQVLITLDRSGTAAGERDEPALAAPGELLATAGGAAVWRLDDTR